MRRALHVLEGLGPQELEISYYDHPYFGQLFLAGVFKLIGFPDIVNPTLGDRHSIEMLYTIPRILMGLMAVFDTFLVYKICERRYNRNVAFTSSILFAVMPITWLLRLILLDVILLPFLLLSILFAVYVKDVTIKNQHKKIILLIFLSGVFLGLAIFTKASSFTMIPLVGLLIFSNRSNIGWNRLCLWFIPLLLIPLIWPAYAMYLGDFDKWIDGVLHQATEREGRSVLNTVNIFFKIDPVLLALGIASISFVAVVKKDFIPLVWVMPLLLFFYISGFSSLFHYVPLLPAFCIAAGSFIDYLITKVKLFSQAKEDIVSSSRRKTAKYTNTIRILKSSTKRSSLIAPITIGIFGLVVSFMLVTSNTAAFQFDALNQVGQSASKNSNVTIISVSNYAWIFQYVFEMKSAFGVKEQRPVTTENVIMMVDENFKDYLADNDGDIKISKAMNTTTNIVDDDLDTIWQNKNPNSWLLFDLGSEKYICGVKISGLTDSKTDNLSISVSDKGTIFKDVYSGNNYTSSYIFDKYDIPDVVARYLKINFQGSTTISEIDVYGNIDNMPHETIDSCKSLQIANISGPVSAVNIFQAFNNDDHKSGKLFKDSIRTLYNVVPPITKFMGSAENYDTSKYPYTSMGYYSSGSNVEIRAN